MPDLEEQLKLFRLLVEHSLGLMCVHDLKGVLLLINPAAAEALGYTPQECVGGSIRDLLTPSMQPLFGAYLRRIRRKPIDSGLMHLQAKDGTERIWYYRNIRYDEPGGLSRVLGHATDLTERKQAQEALRQSERRFAAFMDNLPACAWMKDTQGRYAYLNKGLAQLPEYRGSCLGKTDAELLPFEIAAHYQRNDKTVITRNEALQTIEPYMAKGERRYMLVSKFPIFDHAGVLVMVGGVGIDITERERAEEALRASEERLRFAAQAAGFGSYDLDLVTGQAYRSPEYKALFGLKPEEEFQFDADHLPIYLHPDDRALVRKAVLESRDPQGSGMKDLEYRVILPNGRVRWLLARGRTFFEGEGRARRPVRSLGIALDVTERKQLEQEILEISGREQRRIGHDLHDDLCQRLGGLQLLSGVLEKELAAEGSLQAPQAGRILAQVREALERARRLAQGLAPVALDRGGLVTALQELADDAAKLYHLPCDFRGEVVLAIADPDTATHLYRIAQEAITNAAKHGRAKRITICLVEAGDQCELKVKDDGRGFARRKAATAGMGLRIMKYRAAMIGASLEVRSDAGRGTTVTCVFSKHLCGAGSGANALEAVEPRR